MDNLYDTLQIRPDAAPDVVKAAYKALARKYHPDNLATADEQKFKAVALAYEVLGNPIRRSEYDRLCTAGHHSTRSSPQSQGNTYGQSAAGADKPQKSTRPTATDHNGRGHPSNRLSRKPALIVTLAIASQLIFCLLVCFPSSEEQSTTDNTSPRPRDVSEPPPTSRRETPNRPSLPSVAPATPEKYDYLIVDGEYVGLTIFSDHIEYKIDGETVINISRVDPSETFDDTIMTALDRDDHDLDGIVGTNDKCPVVTEDLDGIADKDGCPEEDADGDGVLDTYDQCPMKPGLRPTGCPTPESRVRTLGLGGTEYVKLLPLSGRPWRKAPGRGRLRQRPESTEHAVEAGGVWFCEFWYEPIADTCVPIFAEQVEFGRWYCRHGFTPHPRDQSTCVPAHSELGLDDTAWRCLDGYRHDDAFGCQRL